MFPIGLSFQPLRNALGALAFEKRCVAFVPDGQAQVAKGSHTELEVGVRRVSCLHIPAWCRSLCWLLLSRPWYDPAVVFADF